MRAYVERCNNPPVLTLITLGTPHSGIISFPGCTNSTSSVDASVLPDIVKRRLPAAARIKAKIPCIDVNSLVDEIVYETFSQEHIIPAQYFKVPLTSSEHLFILGSLAAEGVSGKEQVSSRYKQ